jgi:sugar/nucleoside kinase (ribokinase family)
MNPLNTTNLELRGLIGVGGIGSGMFFAINGDQPLGREESRSGRMLDQRDYCKLHIIAHYARTLLGPDFETYPIGNVGNDAAGRRLADEMAAAGMSTDHIRVLPDLPTLFSFCFQYPDGAGGNLTADNSACSVLDPEQVAAARREFARLEGRGIALAAPEVPLAAREKLLQMGAKHGLFNVAAFTSEEIALEVALAAELKSFESIDLLALNRDEAMAAVEAGSDIAPELLVKKVVERFRAANEAMMISVTAGADGSWAWDGEEITHMPALSVEAASTAGAGDAHLAGILAGLAAGLKLAQAQQLGTLLAALSVTSPHTIHPEAGRDALGRLAERTGVQLDDDVRRLLLDQ